MEKGPSFDEKEAAESKEIRKSVKYWMMILTLQMKALKGRTE